MDVVIAPTEIHLTEALRNVKNNIHVASQDISQYERGAFRGTATADKIKDLGINWTLTGHYERRTFSHKLDKTVALKTRIALENNMNVILCIGEHFDERKYGRTNEVNAHQLEAV
jgi:triosephosphate isomerase